MRHTLPHKVRAGKRKDEPSLEIPCAEVRNVTLGVSIWDDLPQVYNVFGKQRT